MALSATLELRPLGKTGIQVSPVGMGVMEFAGGGSMMGFMFPVIPQDQKNAIIKAALDGGVNWFDSAELYGGGVSEHSLAAALEDAGVAGGEVVVATKWWPMFRTAGNIPITINDRIRNLDGYGIDLYMVHQPWGFSSPKGEMNAMADLVEQGKIRSVGVSNFNAQRMRSAYRALQERGLPLAANQMHYSLLHREIETDGVLEAAKELGVTIIAYTPLETGLLTGKYHKNPQLLESKGALRRRMLGRRIERTRPLIEAMEEIGANYGATPAQVALNWLIHFQGETVVVIPGATRVEQARENAGAMTFRLTDDELNRLDELSRKYR